MPPQTKGPSLDLLLICGPGRRPATWGAETERGEREVGAEEAEEEEGGGGFAETEPQ